MYTATFTVYAGLCNPSKIYVCPLTSLQEFISYKEKIINLLRNAIMVVEILQINNFA